jgi:hypothetical protein
MRKNDEASSSLLEEVLTLDPKFEAPYLLTDGLLTLQAKRVPRENYYEARRILERGMAEFPFDQALWVTAGQFFAYLAPGGLDDPKEQDEWRLAGGRTLARACELVGSNDDVPFTCIAAAGLLTRAGAAVASRQFLERMLQVSDDPEMRDLVTRLLKKAVDGEASSPTQARREQFQRLWADDLSFVTRGALLTIGPSWNAAACAGNAVCSTSWRDWAENDEHLRGATSELP